MTKTLSKTDMKILNAGAYQGCTVISTSSDLHANDLDLPSEIVDYVDEIPRSVLSSFGRLISTPVGMLKCGTDVFAFDAVENILASGTVSFQIEVGNIASVEAARKLRKAMDVYLDIQFSRFLARIEGINQ